MALMRRLLNSCIAAPRRFYSSAAAIAWSDYDWEEAYPVAAVEAGGHMVGRGVQWVMIGSPGVEKTAYATKLARLLQVPHISMGALVREELRLHSSLCKQLSASVSQGKLLPDNIIFKILSKRLELGVTFGETGFIVDGFPRTRIQAEILDHVVDIDLAINFKCKEEDKLIKRCLRRKTCPQCGKIFNLANIDVKGPSGSSKIRTSCVQQQCACSGKSASNTSNTEEILKEKLRIYSEQSKSLEDYYSEQKKLLNFEVPGDIQETWPGLLAALHLKDVEKPSPRLTS